MPKPNAEPNFRQKVESIVAQIPTGKVMTYGQIAALAGNARAARIVGGIAHFGDSALPWQRVVSKTGMLASGYPGGRTAHRLILEQEGVVVATDNSADVEHLLWWPKNDRESSRELDR